MTGGLTDRDLQLIALRGRTLDERRAAPAPTGGPLPPAEVLEPWIKAFAAGDREAFARRLAWDRWDEDEARRCLAREEGEEVDRLRSRPPWTEILTAACEQFPVIAGELATRGAVAEEEYFEPHELLPFLELWVPFLRVARRRLADATPQGMSGGFPLPVAASEQRLLNDLVAVSVVALFERFAAFRSRHRGGPAAGDKFASESRRLYRAFVAAMLAGELVAFFKEYSLLARQACHLVATWVDAHGELALRLGRDRDAIAAVFGAPLGAVVEVETGLSDRHNGGRQVMALRFASGPELIYKPRPMALEAAYNALLGWLAERGLDPAPRALRVLDRGDYGWVERVASAPAASAAEVRQYYRRAGSLLGVAYVLRGDDLHAENVIAARDGPVLVDAETLVQPRTALGPVRDWPGHADQDVLRSQLLSSVQTDAAGKAYDSGGLCGRGGYVAELRRRIWHHPNTDAMGYEQRTVVAEPGNNVLYLDGTAQDPEDYPEELAEGFARTYRFLCDHRDELLAAGGPWQRFRECEARVLLRPSQRYGLLLSILAKPRYQRTGPQSAFLIDSLNRVFREAHDRPVLWPLVREERQALEGRDVPYFSVGTNEATIRTAAGEVITGHFETSGFEAVTDQLASLSESDLGEQLELLRGAERAAAGPRDPGERMRGLSPEQLVAQARELGEIIRHRAVAAAGTSGWPWLLPEDCRGRPPSLNLYDGACGVGLFLAALARVSGRGEYRDLALAACEPVAQALGSAQESAVMPQEVGACSGLGGIVYALVGIGRLLGEERCIGWARQTAERIEPRTIAADRRLDVADGVAGALLGLLALCDHLGEPALLARATACGERLLTSGRPAGGGRAWPGHDGALRTGFAHGASGVAYALSRLARLVPQADSRSALLAAAGDGWRYERSLFSPPYTIGWCTGAAGIGLARLGLWEVLRDDAIRADLDAALRVAMASVLASVDHLCCGNMGVIELLVEAGLGLQRPDLLSTGCGLAARVAQRAEGGGFRLDRADRPFFDPGFFRGISGIGYSLLRLAHPELLPSVAFFSLPVSGTCDNSVIP